MVILKALIQQLLDKNDHLLPPCYTRCISSGEPVLRSLSQVKLLLEDLCAILSKTYFIVDGLDECEPVERKQVIDILMDVAGQCEKNDPGKLRLLFVSQNFTDIKRALHTSSQTRPVPRTMQLGESDNKGDINAYVRIWVNKIAVKYEPFSDDLAKHLHNLTVQNAKGLFDHASRRSLCLQWLVGMFLYARLVIENLHAQPTRGDLIEGIRQENFPEGLRGA